MIDIWVCHDTKSKAIMVSLRLMVQLGWHGISGIQRPCEALSAFASCSHWVWWIHPGKLHLMVKPVAQRCPGAPPAPHSLCRRQLCVAGQPLLYQLTSQDLHATVDPRVQGIQRDRGRSPEIWTWRQHDLYSPAWAERLFGYHCLTSVQEDLQMIKSNAEQCVKLLLLVLACCNSAST